MLILLKIFCHTKVNRMIKFLKFKAFTIQQRIIIHAIKEAPGFLSK